jgi:hypothetical protein
LGHIVDSKFISLRSFIDLLQRPDSDNEDDHMYGDVLDALFSACMSRVEGEFKRIEEKAGTLEATYSTVYHPDMGAGVLLDAKFIPPVKDAPATHAESSTAAQSDDFPDFRTVKPETDEEDQLQRVFEVMKMGGKDWELLHQAIAFSWGSTFAASSLKPEDLLTLVKLRELIGDQPEAKDLLNNLERLLEAKEVSRKLTDTPHAGSNMLIEAADKEFQELGLTEKEASHDSA